MSRELRTVGEIAPEAVAPLAHAAAFETLEDVLHVLQVRRWSVAEIVIQDEYTHDVIVATPGPYLVFDTT